MEEDFKKRQMNLQRIARDLQSKLDSMEKGEKIPEDVIEKIREQWGITLTHTQAVIESSKVYPPYYNMRYSNNPYGL